MAEKTVLQIIDQHIQNYKSKGQLIYKPEIQALEDVKQDIKGELEDE